MKPYRLGTATASNILATASTTSSSVADKPRCLSLRTKIEVFMLEQTMSSPATRSAAAGVLAAVAAQAQAAAGGVAETGIHVRRSRLRSQHDAILQRAILAGLGADLIGAGRSRIGGNPFIPIRIGTRKRRIGIVARITARLLLH